MLNSVTSIPDSVNPFVYRNWIAMEGGTKMPFPIFAAIRRKYVDKIRSYTLMKLEQATKSSQPWSTGILSKSWRFKILDISRFKFRIDSVGRHKKDEFSREENKQIALYLLKGTRPHIIAAKDGGKLSFMWHKRGVQVIAASVRHPGTKPSTAFIRGLRQIGAYATRMINQMQHEIGQKMLFDTRGFGQLLMNTNLLLGQKNMYATGVVTMKAIVNGVVY